MMKLCFCRERQVDLDHATYVINGTPACGRDCYEEMLEALGVSIHHVAQVTYRRAVLVAS
jgi:hypothetical protein